MILTTAFCQVQAAAVKAEKAALKAAALKAAAAALKAAESVVAQHRYDVLKRSKRSK